MKVAVFAVMHNEAAMLPYWLRHYLPLADRVTIFDDHSDDGTPEMAAAFGCAVRPCPGAGLDDQEFVDFAAATYPEVRGEFDWCLWVDADEFIYHPDLRGRLAQYQAEGVALPHVAGYAMFANAFPTTAGQIYDEVKVGARAPFYDKPVVFEAYADSRTLGGFILIDKISNRTVGAGMLHFSLRRAQNVHWQATDIGREEHANLKNQKPRVLWFTGLSGSGKSTIANEVEKQLNLMNRHTFLLDGDNVRHGLNKDLGFTEADRIENIRRVGEVAKLMTDAGLIVLTAFISPFRAERDMVRAMMPEGEFIEIFVDTPLEVAEARDVKGLYKKARSGALKNFTGIDSPYEAPINPEIRVNTVEMTPVEAAEHIIRMILPLK